MMGVVRARLNVIKTMRKRKEKKRDEMEQRGGSRAGAGSCTGAGGLAIAGIEERRTTIGKAS